MASRTRADRRTARTKRIPQRRTQRKSEARRHFINLQPRATLSLHGFPPELRLQIWEHLLVSPNTVTPRYRVCYGCGLKTDTQTRRAAQHTKDCIWDPRLCLNLYPNILQTCRQFYNEGIDLLYTKNRFTNLCQDADATAAVFFQSIGESNARRIQSYTLSWPSTTPGPALIYLSQLPDLQSLTIKGFDKREATKVNLQWLSRIRAKDVKWEMADKQTMEEYSDVIEGKVVKRKLKSSWAKTITKVGRYEVYSFKMTR